MADASAVRHGIRGGRRVRGGQAHDASAAVYVGLNVYLEPRGLFVLDWEAVEVGAGDIELWFGGVGRWLAGYAEQSRMGSGGVYVERAGLGEMLLAKALSGSAPKKSSRSLSLAARICGLLPRSGSSMAAESS
jgi:hypothetical protein